MSASKIAKRISSKGVATRDANLGNALPSELRNLHLIGRYDITQSQIILFFTIALPSFATLRYFFIPDDALMSPTEQGNSNYALYYGRTVVGSPFVRIN